MLAQRPALAALLLLAAAGPAAAQGTVIWTGLGSDSLWSNGGNYSVNRPTGAAAPDNLTFDSTSLRLTNIVDADFTVYALTASNPTASVVFNGTTTRLTVGGVFGTGGIDLSAAGATSLTVNPLLTVGLPQSWTVASGRSLILNGAVTNAGNALALNEVNATTGSTGTVTLAGSNAFSGGGSVVTFRNGTLQLTNANSLAGAAGLLVAPLAAAGGGTQRATANLNVAGTVASYPVTLTSAASTLRSTFQSLNAGSTTFNGAFTLSGAGTAGVVELNVQGGASSALTLGGTVGGGYTGTLQLGGAGGGTGRLNNTLTLSTVSGTVAKVDSLSTWTLAAANTGATGWANTVVGAGTLRTTIDAALPATATLTLGQPNATDTERLGTLDLFGSNQTVASLLTGSDNAQVNPAGNLIGIGSVTGPGAFTSTLTYAGGTSVFRGAVVDSVGTTNAGVTKAVGVSATAGDLTLGAANTYTGPTFIDSSAILRLATVTSGAFVNNGSFATSPTVSLANTNARLNVTGLTGGTNYDAVTTNQFALATNQTLRGVGTVTGGVTVRAASTIRGGIPTGQPGAAPTGQLTVNGNLVVQGGTAGTGGGQLAIDLNGATTTGATVGRVAATGGAVNFSTGGGAVVIALRNDAALPLDVPVSFVVGTADGGYQRNGTGLGAGSYTYLTDYTLTTLRANPDPQTGNFFSNVSLTSDGAVPATLTLTFTPVPEPATVLGLATIGLGAVRLARRRILAG